MTGGMCTKKLSSLWKIPVYQIRKYFEKKCTLKGNTHSGKENVSSAAASKKDIVECESDPSILISFKKVPL